ncbi:GTPase domain-containing protein [Microcoleus sp. CAWBG640]|uniref:GTPase domain-containing protein n=1 Tax=Microcoleus sp. CAWBG640 TaxID=2841653 RepID=UPI00312B3163
MSKKGIFFIIFFLIVFIFVIVWIFYSNFSKPDAAVTIAIFVFGALGAWLFNHIRDDLDCLLGSIFIKKSTYRICVFGRAGSGKTTFIETAFTLTDPDRNRISTDVFDYYKFPVQVGLKNFRDVAIADYQGQNPSQVILESPPDFFGTPKNRVINAILFIVDLVPRKVDGQGLPYNDEDILKWLKNGDISDKIEERVREHYDYIGDAMLQVMLSNLYSKNLKTVIVLINKLDIIEKLTDNGDLTLSNSQNPQDYAKQHFKRMIDNISRACDELNINDFFVFTASGKRKDHLTPLIAHLLRRRS